MPLSHFTPLKPLLICAAMCLPTSSTLAEDATDLSPIKQAALSGELFQIGLSSEDPLLLITAAKLRRALNLSAIERTPDRTVALTGADAPDDPVTWQQMLETATRLAGDDIVMLSLIDDVRNETTKGVATGQVYSITSIRAKGQDTYPPLPYVGGDYGEVYVEGSGEADLNVTVLDSQNRLVCADTDKSAIAYCGWRPAKDGTFTIVVENRSNRGSAYTLITN